MNQEQLKTYFKMRLLLIENIKLLIDLDYSIVNRSIKYLLLNFDSQIITWENTYYKHKKILINVRTYEWFPKVNIRNNVN